MTARFGRMKFQNGQHVYGYDIGQSSPSAPEGRALVRTRLLWIAWFPRRGSRCSLFVERVRCAWDSARDGWHVSVAFGPAYLGLGPGTPEP